MTLTEIKKNIVSNANEMHFEYKGKKCGIDQEIHDSIPKYEMWFGEKLQSYSNFDEMVKDKFFDEKSIIDLIGEVEFWFA